MALVLHLRLRNGTGNLGEANPRIGSTKAIPTDRN
jgi:hypothetical protein